MNEERDVSEVKVEIDSVGAATLWIIFLLVLLFAGDPDLYDGLMNFLMK